LSLLKTYDWNKLTSDEQNICLRRPRLTKNNNVAETVTKIVQAVREKGDAAVKSYTASLDGAALEDLRVSEEELQSAAIETSEELKAALAEAIRSIRLFHEAQRTKSISVETSPGVICEKRSLPIEKVGLYIPGGTAPLPSTLMMLAVPALVAGCREIVLTTPPGPNGKIHPVILTAASLLGLKNIYKCGGAQAIAAMAFGTETIPKVDKIFGPGNAWVTEAKMQVAYDTQGAAIDLPAGPSEVLVIADEKASAVFVAADLLSQAEHDPASQVVLVSTSSSLLEQVQTELRQQLDSLPRKEIARTALESSRAILADSLETAMMISNRYAPEHLIIQVENPRQLAESVTNAGSVFLGPWTPESVGDYASGTNHVLPTYGFARAFSGVGLETFMKSVSFQELSPLGLQNIGPTVECLARAEGLHAHERAVTLRLQNLQTIKDGRNQ
jgi:histidinol dehydrogenase